MGGFITHSPFAIIAIIIQVNETIRAVILVPLRKVNHAKIIGNKIIPIISMVDKSLFILFGLPQFGQLTASSDIFLSQS